jgi:hypothetical protein
MQRANEVMRSKLHERSNPIGRIQKDSLGQKAKIESTRNSRYSIFLQYSSMMMFEAIIPMPIEKSSHVI